MPITKFAVAHSPKFSIIIPHRNIPHLLNRLLDTIPIDENIQVIIVDDNSDAKIVDFSKFPGIDRPYTDVIFSHEGKGAGYARNIGLKYAKGLWIVFADSDDLFSDRFPFLIKQYADSDADEIVFNVDSLMSDDLTQESHRSGRDTFFKEWNSGKEEGLRFVCHEPWGRMIKRSLIENNHLQFALTRYSNDTFFITSVHVHAKTFYVVDEIFYIVTERKGSLSNPLWDKKSKPSIEECKDRLRQNVKAEILLQKHKIDVSFKSYWGFLVDYTNHYPIRVWLEPFYFFFSAPYFTYWLFRIVFGIQRVTFTNYIKRIFSIYA